MLIVGDLNQDLLNPNFHNLKDLLLLNSLENVINEPTRQQAIFDPTIISDDLPFLDSGTITTPSTISDHKTTFIRIPFQYQCQKPFKRLVWLYKKVNFDLLQQSVLHYDWNCEGSVNDACVKFTNLFLGLSKAVFLLNTSQSAPMINLGLTQKYVALHESDIDLKKYRSEQVTQMIGSSIKRPETKLITSENMLKKIFIIIWNYPFLTSTKMIRKKFGK